jgi:signal transduction histidine kinase
MRLVPQSLFARLMWVLLAGLIIAQLLSAAINFDERDRLLFKASGIQFAQRIADTVQLLDPLNPAERKRIVTILNVPPQNVTLDRAPMDSDEKNELSVQADMFSGVLQTALGDKRQIRVAQTTGSTTAENHSPGYGRRRAMLEGKDFVPGMYRSRAGAPGAEAASFLVQVRLQDGQWVTFDTAVSKESAALPLRLFISLAVLLLAVVALSLIAVRWVTRPLQLLSSAAEGLGKDIHRPPLPETGPTEVVKAARAFNTMQARLLRFIQDRSRIFSAMSHDLKTPITRLRLRAELLEDDDLRLRFEKDLKEMEAMVIESLDFMRGLEGRLNRQPVDIMALLESLQADCAEMGHQVEIEGKAVAPFLGDVSLLKRCLINLIDNAIRYGKRAKVIVVDQAEYLTLIIQDDGSGIPENEREKVFEPFYRLEESRSRDTGGTGLGLSIARSIVEYHNGSIVLENRPSGGLEVIVKLPRLFSPSKL